MPAYIVLANAVLEELARARPQSVDALLGIKGIGPSKVRQYGEELLEMFAAPVDARAVPAVGPGKSDDDAANAAFQASALELPAEEIQDDTPRQQSAAAPPSDRPSDAASESSTAAEAPENHESPQSSHYWTWRLLSAGFTPEECATIRSLSAEVVFDHCLRAADAGHTIDAAWFLDPELIASIERVMGPGTPTRIRQLLERLPRGTRYEEVQLVLKSRRSSDKPL